MNDWQENPNGEAFISQISRTGRPDLQRRGYELLATLGPRISEIEDRFARDYGWTPDKSTRVWETNPASRGPRK
jgi:hypothetical protein